MEFGTIDKANFVNPKMSDLSFDEVPKLFSEACRISSANLIWRSLNRRPKRVIRMDAAQGRKDFWTRVIAKAPTVGPMPILIAPYHPFGEEMFARIRRRQGAALDGYNVVHEKNVPSGDGVGYHGTIEGIRVYCGPHISSRKALLCSSQLIRKIRYSVVHGNGDVADFRFLDGEDLAASGVRVRLAQGVEWSDSVFVEFRLEDDLKNRKPTRRKRRNPARRPAKRSKPRKFVAGRKKRVANWMARSSVIRPYRYPLSPRGRKRGVFRRFGRPTRCRRIPKQYPRSTR